LWALFEVHVTNVTPVCVHFRIILSQAGA